MELEQTLVVQAPPDAVWAFLTDPHRVAGCLPGAAITGQLDEHTWAGTITVKVGPVSTSYKGKVTFERLDTAARTAEIQASVRTSAARAARRPAVWLAVVVAAVVI